MVQRHCDLVLLGGFAVNPDWLGNRTLPEDALEYDGSIDKLMQLLSGLFSDLLVTLPGHEKCSPAPQYSLLRARLTGRTQNYRIGCLGSQFREGLKKRREAAGL
jgi:hypothetical protein